MIQNILYIVSWCFMVFRETNKSKKYKKIEKKIFMSKIE